MQKENLEQKISLMDKFRGLARKTIGAYALTLALGGALGGCETEEGDNGDYSSSSTGCSYIVGGNKVESGETVSGCPSGYHCESYNYTTRKDGMGPTKTSYSCVSDSRPNHSSGGIW
ncbi:hypothetical protein HY636_04825 [Candidatus Woesearchaeota archaeon]|nr:hypothetical protein [Candidatus Woesearchaeota archaeon]